jgi:hypothetical protein
MHADRTNRVALAILGFLLLAVGVAGLVASLGGFGTEFAEKALFTNRVSRYFGEHGSWLWPVIAVGCALIALIMLRWIYVLIASTDRADDIVIRGDHNGGRTELRPGALAAALRDEIMTYHGVSSANARVLGDPGDLRLFVAVAVLTTADIPELRQRIETQALAHARQAIGKPDLPIRRHLDVSEAETARVR